MKALLSIAPGGAETLRLGELPDPAPGAGELLIRVKACAVNFPDALVIEDRYQHPLPRPFAPGYEIAGVVAGIGAGVSGFANGDRVMALAMGGGGLAELAVVKAVDAFVLSDAQGFEAAAALPFTYATCRYALRERGQLAAGETLLVLGAGGGIGLAAVELGRALGARVVAAASSEEKAHAAREAGAAATLVYPREGLDPNAQRALAAMFKQAIGGSGADVILDPVGGDYAEPALRAIATGGRYLVIGFPAGIPRLPLNLPLLKSCDIRGVAWGAWAQRHPEPGRALIEDLLAMWAAGDISPRVSRVYRFEQGADAIAALRDRAAIGKLVVAIG